uniref:Exocyst complex component Sec3 PIP2-binding N-terminal domain-containing protein n=1 Tax=Latimeria chalumnae TaxID=7897 RepID=H3BD58_LATCH
MSSIWSTLQRQLYTPQEERLLGMVTVWKAGKKRKSSTLCAVVTTERPVQVSLEKVKKADRGEQYKQSIRWSMRDLKLVDGKDAVKEDPDFNLHLDKMYKWTASNRLEKNAFIACLWKLNCRYLSKKVKFINIPSYILEEGSSSEESRRTGVEAEEDRDDPYQELTIRESADIDALMNECDCSIANADAFTRRLSQDLQVLDEANLRSIIASEKQVTSLMEFLEEALADVNIIEKSLLKHDKMLQTMKKQMDHLHQSDCLLHLIDTNQEKLKTEVLFLVENLDLSEEHCRVLNAGDLSNPSSLKACIEAAGALSSCTKTKLLPGHRKLQAVAEQLIKFESLRQNFEKCFVSHINNIFLQQGSNLEATLTQQSKELMFLKHSVYHQQLLPYVPLMSWLKSANQVIFRDLPKVYAENLGKVYERQIKDFFNHAKFKLLGGKEPKRFSMLYVLTPGSGGCMVGLPDSVDASLPSISLNRSTHRTLHSDLKGSDPKESDKGKYSEYKSPLMQNFNRNCRIEFCILMKFLPMASKHITAKCSIPLKSDSQLEQSVQKQCKKKTYMSHFVSTPSCYYRADHYLETQVLKSHRRLMYISLMDGMPAWSAVVGVHVFTPQPVRDTIAHLMGHCQLYNIVFRRFVLMSLCKEIDEAKAPKKNKVGILPFVSHFVEFVTLAEEAFKNAERRGDLDNAYSKLISAIFTSIERLGSQHMKILPDVLMMENFHHVYRFLAHMKVSKLEHRKNEAKQKYQWYLQSYVAKYLGKPMEKLNDFFDGVKSRVAQGVKQDEVSYQLAFSKQELRKVIEKYPGREVKKSLEMTYRKVVKDLSTEENLLPVVWHAMQEEFIRQYKEFEELIDRCYPGSGVTMEFTMDNLLDFFSSITLMN